MRKINTLLSLLVIFYGIFITTNYDVEAMSAENAAVIEVFKEYDSAADQTTYSVSIRRANNDIFAINFDFSYGKDDFDFNKLSYTDLVENFLSAENTNEEGRIRVALASGERIENDGIILLIVFNGKGESLKVDRALINENDAKVTFISEKPTTFEKVTIVEPDELKINEPSASDSIKPSSPNPQSVVYNNLNTVDLEEILSNSSSNTIYLSFTNDELNINQSVLMSIITDKKILIFEKVDDKGSVAYRWIINGGLLNYEQDMALKVNISPLDDQRASKFQNENITFIELNESMANSITGVSLELFIGDAELITRGEDVFINYLVDDELSLTNKPLILKNGYVTIDKFISNKLLVSIGQIVNVVDDDKIETNTLLLIGAVVLGFGLALLVFINNKKAKEVEDEMNRNFVAK